jgi:putative transposase
MADLAPKSIYHRRLPHLSSFFQQPIVFLTAVTLERQRCLCSVPVLQALRTIWERSPELDGWFVGDFLLMPDHVHLFARSAAEAKPLATWVETWKSISARRLKAIWPLAHGWWQEDYFDRYLRSAENYRDKWDYVAANPVRAGLCKRAEDWAWKGRLFDLQF